MKEKGDKSLKNCIEIKRGLQGTVGDKKTSWKKILDLPHWALAWSGLGTGKVCNKENLFKHALHPGGAHSMIKVTGVPTLRVSSGAAQQLKLLPKADTKSHPRANTIHCGPRANENFAHFF